ncbi:MAG: exodeoxyribonuclease VII small subunit [Methanobacteriota archaeon]|jgi:exodeoxyribonuclease VII small subunit|nr:MAG: exodeoxyribonuclease VII small subunit [Euryarchaeota archaeon]
MTKKYEELVTELREIVRKIEDGETSLDESIALYERGTLLVKECEKMLDGAELKITELSRE